MDEFGGCQLQRGMGLARKTSMAKLRLFHGLVIAGTAVVMAQSANAQNFLVNSNFATGDFTGWTVAESGSGGSPHDYGVTSGGDGGSTVHNAGDTYGAFFAQRKPIVLAR